MFDEKLPCSAEFERKVVGIILNDKDNAIIAYERLDGDDFYAEHRCKFIFIAAKELFANGEPVDMVTVSNKLSGQGSLDNIGLSYIADLSEGFISGVNVEYFVDCLVDLRMKRKAIKTMMEHTKRFYENSEPAEQMLASVESELFGIHDNNAREGFLHISQFAENVPQSVHDMRNGKFDEHVVRTGFPDLDRKTGGFFKADLYLIAGRPGMGKSSLTLNMIRRIASRKQPVGMFSLEMSKASLAMRLFADICNLDIHKLRKADVDEDIVKSMVDKLQDISRLPIWIDDTCAIDMDRLRIRAKRLKLEHNVRIIFIDYLQIAKLGKWAESRNIEVGAMSVACKKLAKELDIPVVALSQLNRDVENRKDRRPRLSDLRDSGALEQDADVVMFVHRESEYRQVDAQNKAEIIIAKQRNGPTGIVDLLWQDTHARFTDANVPKFDYSGADSDAGF